MAANLGDDAAIRDKLAAWLRVQTGCEWTLGAFTRYAVGFSWITYGFGAVEAGGAEQGLILRLGPQYGLFAPYSALPQFAALKALEHSGVPLPKVYWWSDDESILGAPFVSALAAQHRCEWQGKPGFESFADVTVENAALKQIEFWEEAYARWALKPLVAGLGAPEPPTAALPGTPAAQLEAQRDRNDGRICALIDWMSRNTATLGKEGNAAFEAALHRHMDRQSKFELSRSAKPMFAEMSAGAE